MSFGLLDKGYKGIEKPVVVPIKGEDNEFYLKLTYKECISAPVFSMEKILLDKSNEAVSAAFQWGPLIISEMISRQHSDFARFILGAHKEKVLAKDVNPYMKYLIIMGAYYSALKDGTEASLNSKDKDKLIESIAELTTYTNLKSDEDQLDECIASWYIKVINSIRHGSDETIAIRRLKISNFNSKHTDLSIGIDTILKNILMNFPFDIIEKAKRLTIEDHYTNGRLPVDFGELSVSSNKDPVNHYFLLAWYWNEMFLSQDSSLAIDSAIGIDNDARRFYTNALTDSFTLAYGWFNKTNKKAVAFETVLSSLSNILEMTEDDDTMDYRSEIEKIINTNRDLL